ncbi:hypothetical protein IscW_ISCW005662 [Ixodes scapularis]|uniref:Uncharacterized protein n=1 Tax=Ixodes scapularis TaxID=6945 RepID=B7PM34_IXOSC|nr:hypothetical protein IscW_ISCW005662 [Ixodes scapularis]|eukprot:XP_002434832.1 hypothetical protein IscW_ISCW005662 [Ixodes scapularis]
MLPAVCCRFGIAAKALPTRHFTLSTSAEESLREGNPLTRPAESFSGRSLSCYSKAAKGCGPFRLAAFARMPQHLIGLLIFDPSHAPDPYLPSPRPMLCFVRGPNAMLCALQAQALAR